MMPLFAIKTGADFEGKATTLPEPTVRPRDYQVEAIENAFRLWSEGATGVIIRAPTGSGKTVTGSLVAHRWLSQGDDYRVIIIAHERQLIGQFRDEVQDILGIYAKTEMAGDTVLRREITDGTVRIVVASRATLIERPVVAEDGSVERASRLHKFELRFKWLVILDEVHRWRYGLTSCRHILEYFDQMPFNRRLGLTATPMRGDGVTLEKVCPEVASDYRLCNVDGGKCAVSDGWAVPYDQRFIVVEGVDFKNIREVAHDFREDDLEAMLLQEGMLAKLCQPMVDLVGDRRTLIFSPGVDCAKEVARWLNAHVSPECAFSLDGSIPESARKETYKAHQTGKFQFLSVCGLCREGYNDPGIQAVAVFRPTKSRTLAEQMKGRGCRPLRGLVDGLATPEERRSAIASSGKPDCMIVDLVGITGLADTASTVKLMAEGKPDEVIERAEKNLLDEGGGDVAEHIRRAEAELAAEREKIRLARLERERTAQEEANRRAKLQAEVRYSQSKVEQGQGGRVRNVGSNQVMLFGKHKGRHLSELPIDYLEWCVENCEHLKPWFKASILQTIEAKRAGGERPDPASPAQIGWMRWKGIRFPLGVTKKQAGRLISEWKEMNEQREPGSDDF